MVLEILEVGDVSCNFCDVSDGSQMYCPQTIGLEEYSCLFEPGKKVIVLTLKFDVSKGAVAEDLAADADT